MPTLRILHTRRGKLWVIGVMGAVLLLLLTAALVFDFNQTTPRPAPAIDLAQAEQAPAAASPRQIVVRAAMPRRPTPDTGVSPFLAQPSWGGAVEVYFFDSESNRPVSGVSVKLEGPAVTPRTYSDMDGMAYFRQLPAGFYTLQSQHSLYRAAVEGDLEIADMGDLRPFVLKADEHMELLVELRHVCRVTGRALDAISGEPLAGAKVYPNRYDDTEPVLTDDEGRFDAPSGEMTTALVYLKAPGRSARIIKARCAAGRADAGDILLAPAWELAGKVIDPLGAPIPGVRVRDYPERVGETPADTLIETVTDAEGRFRLTGLPSSIEFIFFYKDGYVARDQLVAPALSANLTVVMSPACVLTGVVTDTAGAPLEGLLLHRLDWLTPGRVQAVTDARGRFTVSGLPPGNVDLLLLESAHGVHREQSVTLSCMPSGAEASVVFDVAPVAYAEGTVEDARGVALGNIMVSLTIVDASGNPGFQQFTFSDPSGQFRLPVNTDKSYQIFAVDLATLRRGALNGLKGSQRDLHVRLTEAGVEGIPPLHGVAVDSEGNLIRRYRYCWFDCADRRDATAEGRWLQQKGNVNEQAPLWILLEDGRVGRADFADLQTPTKRGDVVVTVGKGAAISGRLGRSFDGGRAYLEITSQLATALVSLSVKDAFSLPLLPPGAYAFTFIAADGRSLSFPLVVTDGRPADLGELELP